MKYVPLMTAVLAFMTFVAAAIFPLFFVRIVKVRGRKRIRILTKFEKQVITCVCAFFMGMCAIACTPVLIPYAEWLVDGNKAYPYVATGIVAVLLAAYIVVVYTILTLAGKARLKKLKNSLSG